MLNKNREYDMDKQILGQCKVQPQAESVWFTSRFSRRHCLFLLNRGGDMGETKCKTCDYYTGRWEYASVAHGVWDFKTCNETCPMVEDKISKYNRIWQRNKYRRLHGLAVER